jgi:predicted transcriptional regulator
VYSANLDFKRVKRYLNILEKMGLIGVLKERGKRLYYTTEKGRSFLADYEKVRR